MWVGNIQNWTPPCPKFEPRFWPLWTLGPTAYVPNYPSIDCRRWRFVLDWSLLMQLWWPWSDPSNSWDDLLCPAGSPTDRKCNGSGFDCQMADQSNKSIRRVHQYTGEFISFLSKQSWFSGWSVRFVFSESWWMEEHLTIEKYLFIWSCSTLLIKEQG